MPRDNEVAFISVNGNVCWIKLNIFGKYGTQLCGGVFYEEIFHFKGCHIYLSATAPETIVTLTVRVWANIDGDAADESFGIDNVVVSKLTEDGDPRENCQA